MRVVTRGRTLASATRLRPLVRRALLIRVGCAALGRTARPGAAQVRTILAVLILSAAGLCQLIDAPAPQQESAALVQPTTIPSRFNPVAPPKAPEKVVNREFIAHSAITGALMIADFESALYVQHHDPNLREGDPLFGAHPSHLRMYACAMPLEAANAFLAYQLKKHGHTKLWRVPFFVAETMHVSGIVSNLSPRAGGSFVLF